MIDIVFVLISLAIIIPFLYVWSTACRKGHRGLQRLQGWSYAHRGLHGQGVPENSMRAFRMAVESGYGIELDVHLLADGGLAVIHDSLLMRTTGREGCVEDLTESQLKVYPLEGTEQSIPLLRDVLKTVNGQVPLIVELKPKGNNYPVLCQSVCDLLDSYDGVFCLESFDPRCIFWLRRHRPDLVRGQLTENYFAAPNAKLPWFLKWCLRNQTFNFLTLPDFVAYRYCDRRTLSNWIVRNIWKTPVVSWTLKTRDEYDTAVEEGWIPIFENFIP